MILFLGLIFAGYIIGILTGYLFALKILEKKVNKLFTNSDS